MIDISKRRRILVIFWPGEGEPQLYASDTVHINWIPALWADIPEAMVEVYNTKTKETTLYNFRHLMAVKFFPEEEKETST